MQYKKEWVTKENIAACSLLTKKACRIILGDRVTYFLTEISSSQLMTIYAPL